MNNVIDIASWSPMDVVEALVVDDHANARARSLNAEPKYGGAFPCGGEWHGPGC